MGSLVELARFMLLVEMVAWGAQDEEGRYVHGKWPEQNIAKHYIRLENLYAPLKEGGDCAVLEA
jgi:hypothetical protein